MTADRAASPLFPIAPSTLEATGLPFELITQLALKTLHLASDLSGAEVGRRLGLGFAIVEKSLDLLKTQRLVELVGGRAIGASMFRYRLTDLGHDRAMAALEANRYVGAAPVPIGQYRQYMEEFLCAVPRTVTPDAVRSAFSHLVIADRVLDEIGTAINSGHSIFIYGPPGNGKSAMARAIGSVMSGAIAIPHALEVAGSIVRFFEPSMHDRVEWPDGDEYVRYDQRWVPCRRPVITVGGELTLESLSLAYNPRSGIYYAPVQALANGGVLLIDDFGRQRCSPRELLNWWMVPLESHVELLPLLTGEKLEMPFSPTVIFSTNLKPSELVDEAFLRRIRNKIYAENPTREEFASIFERCCRDRSVHFDRSLVTNMLERFYKPRRISLRACHCGDLIDQALAIATYRNLPRGLTDDLMQEACVRYFIDDRTQHERPD